MATLIPALGSCTGRMTPGERRLAQRLEQKLDAFGFIFVGQLLVSRHRDTRNGTAIALHHKYDRFHIGEVVQLVRFTCSIDQAEVIDAVAGA